MTDSRIAPPLPLDPETCARPRDLLPAIETLRAEIRAAEERFAQAIEAVDAARRDDAKNLVHYLALRRFDLRALHRRLARFGLSSLGRPETRVLPNLEAVTALCRGEAPRGAPPGGAEEVDARRALRAARLFGAPVSRGAQGMATATEELARDPDYARLLLQRGVGCIRIDCDRDGPDLWGRMAEGARRAAEATGREVRILVDLIGPGPRTGAVRPGPEVLRVRPRRDALGQVVEPARLRLVPDDGPRGVGAAHGLPLPAVWLADLRPGDRLECSDARGKRRHLDVVAREGPCAWAEARQGLYLESGTHLHLTDPAGRVPSAALGRLPPVEQTLLLRRADRLLLTAGGEPAQPGGPLRIGCSAPGVFGRVEAGERVLFDDGRIEGVVREAGARFLEIEILRAREEGSRLRADRAIRFPGIRGRAPPLTPAEIACLPFAARYADLVGCSFVSEPEQLLERRERLGALGAAEVPLLLRIDTARALGNLSALLLAALRSSDTAVAISREDLAIECGAEGIAEAQEEILRTCEAARVPVVRATPPYQDSAGDPGRAGALLSRRGRSAGGG